VNAHHIQERTRADATLPSIHTCDEDIKIIRKLCRIGLDDDAKRLQHALRTTAPENRGTVLADPLSTD